MPGKDRFNFVAMPKLVLNGIIEPVIAGPLEWRTLPDITDGTHVGFLARVNPLVDPELSLVVELLITEVALVQELAPVFVLAVLPLAPVLVAGPTDRADIPGLVPANIYKIKLWSWGRVEHGWHFGKI